MSSLQKQLAALRTTRTNELDLKAQKNIYSKSLLFEPKVAASQSLDTLFQICYEGFQDLCALDSRFTKYQGNIFSPYSKSQDRNLMTPQENSELNEVLESFLYLVGARLQLKPAQKALEWLIRRFRVNDLNVEAFVLTFLPYHTLPFFATMMSILPTQLPPSLKFLNRYVGALQNPPRAAFVQATVQYPAFFTALNQYMLKASRAKAHHRSLISTWTSVMVQSIDSILSTSVSARQGLQQQREEELYTRLFPILNETLGSKSAPELVLGSYMVVLVLVGKASLSDEVLDSLMKAISSSWTGETAFAGLCCIGQIAEQRGALTLPRSVVKAAFRLDNLEDHILAMSKQQSTDRLMLGLVETQAKSSDLERQLASIELGKFVLQHRLLTEDAQRSLVRRVLHRTKKILASTEVNNDEERRIEAVKVAIQHSAMQANGQLSQLPAEDTIMGDAEDNAAVPELADIPALTAEAFDAEVQQLHVRANVTSFLAHSTDATFDKALSLFEQVVSRPEQASIFLLSPLFLPEGVRTYRLCSFLIRVSCTSQSASARARALELCTTHIREHQSAESLYLFLTPYTLAALSDQSLQVRTTAVKLLTTLNRIAGEASKAELLENPRKILGLYEGNERTEDLNHLDVSTKDYATLISILKGCGLEECATDKTRIARIFRDALSSNQQTSHKDFNNRAPRLKSVQRSRLFKVMCDQATSIGSNGTRLHLLHLLNKIDKVDGRPRSQYLRPLFLRHIAHYATELARVQEEEVSIDDYDSAILAIAHHGDKEALTLLVDLATKGPSGGAERLQSAAFTRVRDMWPRIQHNNQEALALSLFHAATATAPEAGGSSQGNDCTALLRSLPIDASTLTRFVRETLDEVAKSKEKVAKKHRTSTGSIGAIASDPAPDHIISKLTLILELTEITSSTATLELFHAIYKTLPEIQRLGVQVKSELSYITTLALSILCSAMQRLQLERSPPRLDTAVVRADYLVDCVQSTSSAQARNSALLLLSMLVKQVPQLVLQSVMPIFTMMSSTTARQNDDFSAHVVNETISAIVPALSKKLQEQRKDIVLSTADIIVSFAAAFDHIPPHRRLQLFSLLASSLGPDQSLFAIVATLVDHCRDRSEIEMFVSTLFVQFNVEVSMLTIQKYIELVADGLSEKSTMFSALTKHTTDGVDTDASLAWHLETVSRLLQASTFRSRVRRSLKDEEVGGALRQTFTMSLQQTVAMSQSTKPALKQAVQIVLEDVLGIFPLETMVKTIEPLFDHTDQSLARTVLKVTEQRVRLIKQASSGTKQAILKLLPRLTFILKDPNRNSIKPAALACIDCICEKFGKSDLDATLAAMQTVASPSCLLSSDTLLKTLSLQCLATTVEILGNDFIPLLQAVVDAATAAMKEALIAPTKFEELHNASFAFFAALEDNLAYMMSKALLTDILSSAQSSAAASLSATAQQSRTQCLQVMSLKADMSILVQATDAVWESSVAAGPKPLLELITLIQSTLEARPKSAVSRSSRDFSALFLNMLGFRRTAQGVNTKYPAASLDRIEAAIHQAFIAYVLKVNDAIFRPFFSQLLDWSTALPKQDIDGRALHSTALFQITHSLSERLKSIFTSYFNSLVERAAEVLQTTSASGIIERGQRIAVVDALTSAFKHDQDDFWSAPSRFDLIVSPLISQLASSPKEYVETHVIPCITELGGAASSSENLKSLNSLILKQFRAESAKTRLAAVKAQHSLAQRLGDEWLANLPEMLPFINELQEDDDEIVERETHKWIKGIEEILGESLSAMLQ